MFVRTTLALAFFGGLATAQAVLPVTTRVSSNPAGAAGNGISQYASLSFDGRYCAFESFASDLVPGDGNGTYDIFLRDRANQTTERISLGPLGLEANGPSHGAALSTDARFCAFESEASNLVAGDTGFRDIFLRDRLLGTTTRVSFGLGGAEPNGDSREACISPDGFFVLFRSSATNLVPGDTNLKDDVFLYDHQAGTIERVSVSTAGAEANAFGFPASLSSGATKLAFWSAASNLVTGDTNNADDVFVRDRAAGTTARISLGPPTPVEPNGAQLTSFSVEASLTADGALIAFNSGAADVVPGDTNGAPDVFVRDLATGATELVSRTSLGGGGAGDSYHPELSADGRFVAYESFADNLTPVINAWGADIYVTDRATGFTAQVSLASSGVADQVMSTFPAISGDGRTFAFQSNATKLVTPDTNKTDDIFVHERKSVALLQIDQPVAGSNLTLTLSDAPPLGGVFIGWTLAGQWATGSPWGILDLQAPYAVLFLPVDAAGAASLVVPLPLALAGSTLFLQGLDTNFVLTSSIGRSVQ